MPMLNTVLDIFRMRQYFNAVLMAGEVGAGLVDDARFLNAVRRSLLPLPFESNLPADRTPFGPDEPFDLTGLEGRRVGLVASGGSGALASVVGAWRAFEEGGIVPHSVAVCSGSAVFGFPLAAGIPAAEVAEFVLGMRPSDYVDVEWGRIGGAALRAGRGFGGIMRGERFEAAYRQLLGDMTLAELKVPCYAPIWNVEHNCVEYMGPETYPELPVVRAIHAAIAIPLFFDPVLIRGGHWCDGGIVDVFPVKPVLDIEGGVDVAVAINGFYPPGFEGDDATGWRERSGSLFHVASQVRMSQQIELARENLARLQRETKVRMIEPVPYSVVRGVGFYRQFLDRSDWPEFMRSGRKQTRIALRSLAARDRARTPRLRRVVQTAQ